jgi:indole-3-glycerol phosphate synthase
MPRYLKGWLKEVIINAYSREYISTYRDRSIFNLKDFIISKKNNNLVPIIAEYKRKSPSGLIAEKDPVEYAKFMEKNGVVGISVITEPLYFGGSYEYLREISNVVKIPVIMKDFIVSEKQIDTAYNLGADSVLLIVKVLTERELQDLIEYSRSYKIEPIVEATTLEEIEMAIRANVKILGINSRNLETLDVNLDKLKDLVKNVPNDVVKIAESGIREKREIKELKELGFDAFLIGTTLMKDPLKIKELITS